MKERPILFSGPMVRAILEGRKTQTRRVVKPQPMAAYTEFDHFDFLGTAVFSDGLCVRTKFGVHGDRLWVRETFSEIEAARTPGDEIPDYANYLYRADFSSEVDASQWGGRWRPSIFMPRAASRITLEVVSVRVERLQDISEADAIAEGVEPDVDAGYWKGYVHPGVYDSAKRSFASLWYSINGRESWDQNPWVWVVEFKRIEP